jgi:GTP-binding protein HflX
MTVLNKIDRLLTPDRDWDEASALEYLADRPSGENTVLISAIRRWGLDELLARVGKMLAGQYK